LREQLKLEKTFHWDYPGLCNKRTPFVCLEVDDIFHRNRVTL